MRQEIIGGKLDDTIGNVSQFFATYPDKDCIPFLEGLVPGEGFHHHFNVQSLDRVFMGSRKTELHLFLIREWGCENKTRV